MPHWRKTKIIATTILVKIYKYIPSQIETFYEDIDENNIVFVSGQMGTLVYHSSYPFAFYSKPQTELSVGWVNGYAEHAADYFSANLELSGVTHICIKCDLNEDMIPIFKVAIITNK